MSASTYDAAGEAVIIDELPERRVVSAKAIAEMEQLHQEVLATKPPNLWSPAAVRRRYRDARVAESDLLRVLGFESWEAFEAHVNPEPELHLERLAATEPGPTPAPMAELVAALTAELASFRAQLSKVETELTDVRAELADASLEVVALRLELMVAAAQRARS